MVGFPIGSIIKFPCGSFVSLCLCANQKTLYWKHDPCLSFLVHTKAQRHKELRYYFSLSLFKLLNIRERMEPEDANSPDIFS